MNPLNKVLYNRLRTIFNRVRVANEGQAMVTGPTISHGGRRRVTVIDNGEYYRVNCPFCLKMTNGKSHDSKGRLWINHRWGAGVPGDEGAGWHLAFCYNAHCLQVPQFRKQLRDMVYTDANMRRSVVIERGTTIAALSREVTWPGVCLPLQDLPADHPACVYLREERRFDPATIGIRHGVKFCISPSPGFEIAVNRLVCPVTMNGRMVSWQARYIGELDWKATNVPKFYNMHGVSKSAALYGYDQAKALPLVTIVEGPMDQWRLGTGAVALLGKTLSETQVSLVCNTWKAAILALDDDAIADSLAAVEKLRRHIPTVLVVLPPGYDPDKMPSDEFWSLVLQNAAEQSIDLRPHMEGIA